MTKQEIAGAGPSTAMRRLLRSPIVGGLLLTLALGSSHGAEAAGRRLFIQVWWDSPAIEMDPSDDPGRLQVDIGETFVGCAVAPSHMNYRKQLMVVPPSVGFTATGEAADVKVTVTGQLATLAGQRIKITDITDPSARTTDLLARAN